MLSEKCHQEVGIEGAKNGPGVGHSTNVDI
jgi:hypothetical protein